jgi:hypothetical protein
MEENKKQLQEEKQLILKKLLEHAEYHPKLKQKIEAKFEDLGSELDDSVHEVEQMEVETTIVGILLERLENINKKLEEDSNQQE